MERKKKKHRVWKIIAVLAGCLAVSLYLLLPIGFGVFASIRPAKSCGTAPDGFQDVTLTTTDGVALEGWYAPGSNGSAILVLHGSKSNRDAVRPYVQFLKDNGYGVLAIDLRGHGLSGGHANAFGWQCTADVGAAVEFLKKQPGVDSIGALGLSMGGEVLLGAVSAYPEISAIVADGASERCTADYVALPANNNLWRSWTTRVMYWSVGLFTGAKPPTPITESIAGAPNTSLLLIAAGQSQNEIHYNTLFADIAGDRAQLWIVPNVGHTGAYAANSVEYAAAVSKFLESSLHSGQKGG